MEIICEPGFKAFWDTDTIKRSENSVRNDFSLEWRFIFFIARLNLLLLFFYSFMPVLFTWGYFLHVEPKFNFSIFQGTFILSIFERALTWLNCLFDRWSLPENIEHDRRRCKSQNIKNGIPWNDYDKMFEISERMLFCELC